MPASQRRTRERDLVLATRRLFDERGLQDAPIDEIARSVGIARGLVYRHFASKEELYVLTVTDYLAELDAELERALGRADDPEGRLECCMEAYAAFCARYPAFLDCSMSLMRRRAGALQASVSESVFLRLGQAMARPLQRLSAVLADLGAPEPDRLANLLWTQALGAMHLARLGVGVREAAPGVPAVFRVDTAEVVRGCVDGAMAAARGAAQR